MELTKHFLFFIKKKPTTHVGFVMWDGAVASQGGWRFSSHTAAPPNSAPRP